MAARDIRPAVQAFIVHAPLVWRFPSHHVRQYAVEPSGRSRTPQMHEPYRPTQDTRLPSQPKQKVDVEADERKQRRKNVPMQWHLDLNRGTSNGPQSTHERRFERREYPSAPKECERVQHVPFEGIPEPSQPPPEAPAVDTTAPIDRDPASSTLTDRERRAFQRLFSSWSAHTPTSSQSPPKASTSNTAASADLTAVDPHAPDTSQFFQPRSSNSSNALSVASFPAELRAMAAQAQRAVEKRRNKEMEKEKGRAEEESWEPKVRKLEEELYACGTDVDVWNVLHEKVLEPLAEIDKSIRASAQAAQDKTAKDDKRKSTVGLGEPNPIVMGCSILITLAFRLLARRTTYSFYADQLLATVKQHSFTASVLGLSTPLYNELLHYYFHTHQSISSLPSLLREMDAAGLETDEGTLEVLDEVYKWCKRAQQGLFGEGIKAVEALLERRKDVEECERWREEVKRRLREKAVTVSEREETERRLEADGALGWGEGLEDGVGREAAVG